MVLDVIAGPDSRDSTCLPSGGGQGGFASFLLDQCGRDQGAAAAAGSPLEGVTVGIPKEFNVEELGEAFFYSKRGSFTMTDRLNIPAKVPEMLLVFGGRNDGKIEGVRRARTR